MSFPSLFTQIALPCIVTAIFAGCSEPPLRPVGPSNLGYNCLPVPSQLHEAGSIFEVDSNNSSAPIGFVEGVLVRKSDNVGFPTYTSKGASKVDFLLSTLERLTASTGWSVRASGELSKNVDVSTSYNDISLQTTLGQPEITAINWFRAQNYIVEPGKRYYFVREAIQAKEVNYEIKRGDLAKIGVEAAAKELVVGKLSLERKDNDSYTLRAKFPSPVNACIKARELVSIGKAATGEQFLSFVDVASPIAITGGRQ